MQSGSHVLIVWFIKTRKTKLIQNGETETKIWKIFFSFRNLSFFVFLDKKNVFTFSSFFIISQILNSSITISSSCWMLILFFSIVQLRNYNKTQNMCPPFKLLRCFLSRRRLLWTYKLRRMWHALRIKFWSTFRVRFCFYDTKMVQKKLK